MAKTEQIRRFQGLKIPGRHVVVMCNPIMFFLIDRVSKNDSFVSKKDLAMLKNLNILLMFSLILSEADLAG